MNSPALDISRWALAASLFALAGAIIYFAYSLQGIATSLPGTLEQAERTIQALEPVTTEVTEVRLALPDMLEEVEQITAIIPGMVEEIALIREQLPGILTQVDSTVSQIPLITAEVDQILADIPPLLDQAANLSTTTITPVLEEVAVLRTVTLPAISSELALIHVSIANSISTVELLREDIPVYLGRIEDITADLEAAGRKASEGAVTGILTGVVKAPFSLISSIGGGGKTQDRLTSRDVDILSAVTMLLLENGEVNEVRDWRNNENGNYGEVILVERSENDSVIRLTALDSRNRSILRQEVTLARDRQGEWNPVSSTDL